MGLGHREGIISSTPSHLRTRAPATNGSPDALSCSLRFCFSSPISQKLRGYGWSRRSSWKENAAGFNELLYGAYWKFLGDWEHSWGFWENLCFGGGLEQLGSQEAFAQIHSIRRWHPRMSEISVDSRSASVTFSMCDKEASWRRRGLRGVSKDQLQVIVNQLQQAWLIYNGGLDWEPEESGGNDASNTSIGDQTWNRNSNPLFS